MQQLGRRAGALDIDLMSNQPGKQTIEVVIVLVYLLRGCIREKIENVRGPRCTGWNDLTAFY